MDTVSDLAKILGIETGLLTSLDDYMSRVGGRKGVLEKVAAESRKLTKFAADRLNSGNHNGNATHMRGLLRQTIVKHEHFLLDFLNKIPDHDEFGRMAALAARVVEAKTGHFLKKEKAEEIFRKRPPENLLRYLGYKNVDELLAKEDPLESFSALRFVESNEWMHATFEEAYGNFTPQDFEERQVSLKVLGPRWSDISKKFVAKKHHNVSHLKEFGVIFLNPIRENVPGKLLRDFALLLHYFHEIHFYSKLFERYFPEKDFAERLKSLLRGDVQEIMSTGPGEWLIVQRYLWKENPKDLRLSLPRVNPESLHWARGERDLANYFKDTECCDLEVWGGFDWVGGLFPDNGGEELVSFDLEDNAMSLVSFMEGKQEFFTYHQREAMWTKLFMEYAGGEAEAEKLLIQNFEKGIIKF